MRYSALAQLAASSPYLELREWFRRYFLRLWTSRGGGFYGFVAALMLVYLEIVDISGDLVGLAGSHLGIGWLIGFLVGNLVDFVLNTIRAAIWPLTWLQQFGVSLWSAVLLGLAYMGYRAVRPAVLRWLQGSGEMSPLPEGSVGSDWARE